LLAEVETARFAGNSLALNHTSTKAPKITWPEKYHERYKLPANIEAQPF
jgi:hypothetical protein